MLTTIKFVYCELVCDVAKNELFLQLSKYRRKYWSSFYNTPFLYFSGLPYAKTADYYNDDYNYSADDEYLNGDGLDGGNGILGENERVVYATPEITSDSTDDIINEGDTIKLPCMVDKLGIFPSIQMHTLFGILC